MKKLAIPISAVLAVILSIILLIAGQPLWPLPAILAIVAVALRIHEMVRRSGNEIATMRRNDERHRQVEKQRHLEVATAMQTLPTHNPGLVPATPLQPQVEAAPPRQDLLRPTERLGGPTVAVFEFDVPSGSAHLDLWLEVGPFDTLDDEFTSTASLDGVARPSARLQAHRSGDRAALGRLDVRLVRSVRVAVAHSDVLDTGLPPHVAFRALLVAISHAVLPLSSTRVQGTRARSDIKEDVIPLGSNPEGVHRV